MFYGLKLSKYIVWVSLIVNSMGIINTGKTAKISNVENSGPLGITHLNGLQFISLMLICHHHRICYALCSCLVYLNVEFFCV